jgi:hypothetical protein
MAEWLRRGLQILARRFDSGSGLHSPWTCDIASFTREIHVRWIGRIAAASPTISSRGHGLESTGNYDGVEAVVRRRPGGDRSLSAEKADRPLVGAKRTIDHFTNAPKRRYPVGGRI